MSLVKSNSPRAWIVLVYVALAMLLGGGGTPNPTTELILELLCAVAVAGFLWLRPADGSAHSGPPPSAWLIAGLVALLPLVQLIPLPPAIWHALGGQQDRIAALALVGSADTWQPISRSPAQTLASLLAMLPPLFLLLAVSSLDAAGRRLAIVAIAAIALVGALFGAIQLSAGEAAPRLYAESHRGVLTGFQANRNAEADILLIGLVAAVTVLASGLRPAKGRARAAGGLAPPKAQFAGPVVGAVAILFLVAVILTASRTGIALIPLALVASLVAAPALRGRGRWRWVAPVGVAFALVAIVGATMARGGGVLAKVASRFALTGDARLEMWRDAWFEIQRSWPFGVGMGGAQSALIAAERLEVLGPAIPNRVHNDYLEILLEGGIVGAALVIVIAALLISLIVSGWRKRPESRAEIVLSTATLLIIGLHSFVDYPLRSMSLSCLAGVAVGLLVGPRKTSQPEGAAEAAI